MKKLFIFLFVLLSFSVLYAQDLSVPVSINSNGAPLSDVCEYLSQQTKLNIVAGKDENDWIVSDRRTIIHVEKVPLQNLLNSICNVFDLKYEIKDNTIYIFASDEQLNNELKLREDFFAKEKNDFFDRQNAALDAMNTGKVSNNYTQLFYNSDYQKNLLELLSKLPDLKEAMINKDTLLINYSKLNDTNKNFFTNFLLSYVDFFKIIQLDVLDVVEILQNPNDVIIQINPNTNIKDKDIEKDSIFSSITIKGSKKSVSLDILNPNGIYTDLIGQAIKRLKNGESDESVAKFLELQVLIFKTNLILSSCTPCENLVGDIFNNKFNLYKLTNRSDISCRDYFDELSKQGLNIVADDFYRSLISIENKDLSMAKYVQNISDNYSLTGVYNNNILEMQDKLYYVKVAGTVPRAWIDYWVVRAYENGGYSLEDLMQIANLNDIQLDTEISQNPDMHKTVDKDFRFNPNEAIYKRNILRFLYSLSDEKLTKMFESNLSAFDIEDEQWKLLQNGLYDMNCFYKKEAKNSQSLAIKRNAGRNVEFIITYESDFSTEPIEIIISTNKMTIKSKNKER